MARVLPEDLWGLEGHWWLLGAVALVGITKGFRPLTKGAIKGCFALRDGLERVTTQTSASLRELYQEARAEYQSTAAPDGREPLELASENEAPPPPGRGHRGSRQAAEGSETDAVVT